MLPFLLVDSSEGERATFEQVVKLGDYFLQSRAFADRDTPGLLRLRDRNEPQLDQAGRGVPRIGAQGSNGRRRVRLGRLMVRLRQLH